MHDLHGIPADECREDFEAAPPLFYPLFGMDHAVVELPGASRGV